MDISEITDKMVRGESASDKEIAVLLTAEGDDRETIFAAAREVRDRVFGKKTYLSGFMYFSTYCRNDCTFCYFRKSNSIDRYRKSTEEVVHLAQMIADAGINIVDLTMGEDPVMRDDGFTPFLDLVSGVRDASGIGIMVSPGTVPRELMPRLRGVGADWIACYQETYDRALFGRVRTSQDFECRRDQKSWAHEVGLLAEDGIMVGIGESAEDRARSLIAMGSTGCDQVRAMAFVPQEGTPMYVRDPGKGTDEIRAIAVMRLMYPDRLIPASLDVEGIAGLSPRLDAGANVVTSIVLPDSNLAGVAQHELDIENGNRSVGHVFSVLGDLGFEPASAREYRGWMEARREALP